MTIDTRDRLYANNTENLRLLRERFPTQFAIDSIFPSYSYPDGWHALVTRACELAAAQPFPVCWFQIKEKFGALRMYPSTGNDTSSLTQAQRDSFWEMLYELWKESSRTCAICSATGGLLRIGGWVITLCPSCGELLDASPVASPYPRPVRGDR